MGIPVNSCCEPNPAVQWIPKPLLSSDIAVKKPPRKLYLLQSYLTCIIIVTIYLLWGPRILVECVLLVCLVTYFTEVRNMKHLPRRFRSYFNFTKIKSLCNSIHFDRLCRDAANTCYRSATKHTSGERILDLLKISSTTHKGQNSKNCRKVSNVIPAFFSWLDLGLTHTQRG